MRYRRIISRRNHFLKPFIGKQIYDQFFNCQVIWFCFAFGRFADQTLNNNAVIASITKNLILIRFQQYFPLKFGHDFFEYEFAAIILDFEENIVAAQLMINEFIQSGQFPDPVFYQWKLVLHDSYES